MTPVSVLTGFLGSGKTTLLRALLRDPALGRTAVIINEFGEIGIDHDLIETSDEDFIALTTGCLCCKVRSDLVITLRDLADRRERGELPAFERVVIETSGLADPAAILQALMVDRELASIYTLSQVITTADATLGLETLDRHPQSLRQVAVADRIVITKSDRTDAQTTALSARLGEINPGADRIVAVQGALDVADLMRAGAWDPLARPPEVRAWLAEDAGHHHHDHHAQVHDDSIVSCCVVREAPISAVTLALFLEALAEHWGERLLRVKGLIHVAEDPARPAVIHGVQHVFHPPEWLDHWPSNDRRSRIVFIGHGVSAGWMEALLDVLEADVAAEALRRRRSA